MNSSLKRILLLIAVVAAGCSSGHKSTQLSTVATSTSMAPSTSPTTAGSTFSTDTVPSPRSSAPPATPTTSTASVNPGPTVAGTKPPAPPSPGTYRYRQSGTATVGGTSKPVPPEGTTLIDAATSSGSQTWHRTVDASQPASDTVFLFHANGVFISQLVMRAKVGTQTQTFTCTFATPLASPPWPPAVGSTYQGHADCGAFTADVHGDVTGIKDAHVGGGTQHAYVLATSIALHGQVEGSGTQTDWVDPATSLLLHEDSSLSAVYGGFYQFGGSTTSDLESVKPS